MQQLKALLQSIPPRRLLLICATALTIGAAILAFAYFQREGDYRPLYTSLAPEDAGAVVQKLKEKQLAFRLSDDGGTVLVPSGKVAETRLEMAALGLPKSGRIGFELFDQTKFGATDFMEHVNFRRALEGELERTITTMAGVEHARVHLTFAKDSVFSENQLPAKGSVMLRLKAALSEQNVSAVRYLVASAVEGLNPESVSVVDFKGNVLGRPKERSLVDGDEPSDAHLEYKQKLEKNLLAKVNSTLEPLLGPERFRASVAADCDFSSGEQSEEIVDPGQSAITTEQHSKEMTSSGGVAGVPGTASNLPRSTPRPGSNTQVTRETSNVAYQTARTIKRTKTPQGVIKHLSVSVLVDHHVRWEGRGANMRRVVSPPTPETLARISELVSASVGLQQERGDKVVVEALPFESTLDVAPPAEPAAPLPIFQKVTDMQNLLLAGIMVALALAAWFVLRNQKNRKPAAPTVEALQALQPVEMAEARPLPATPEPVTTQISRHLDEQRKKRESERHMELEASGAALQRLANEVIELSQKDSELCAGVLRSWITESESKA